MTMSETDETATPRAKPAVAVPETVTDSLGRVLTIRKLDALAELDLIEAAGTNADNRAWMTRATLATCVSDIDGIPRVFPTTRLAIRVQVKWVGAEGIQAVISKLAPEEQETVEQNLPDATAAVAKN
jgi:hypothetical protein